MSCAARGCGPGGWPVRAVSINSMNDVLMRSLQSQLKASTTLEACFLGRHRLEAAGRRTVSRRGRRRRGSELMSRNETAALTSCSPGEPIGRDLVPERQKKNHAKAVVASQNSSISQALSMTTVKALAEGVLLAVEIECIATVHRRPLTADRSVVRMVERPCEAFT